MKKKGRPPKTRAAGSKTILKSVRPEPAPPKRQEVAVTAAKGRPMLTWVGKRPLKRVTVFPAQLVETFNPSGQSASWQNLLFHGDNKDALAWLLANGFRGKVNLIYIDPPFDSGADYVRKVQLRGVAGITKIDGETYSLGEQIQYTDIWANDNYLQFMYERLLLLKELLSGEGTLFVHLDSGRGHYVKVVLDEVFGQDNFRNELVVKRRITKNLQQQFAGIREYPQAHDVVMWYSRDPGQRFSPAEMRQTRREEGYWHHFWSGENRPTMRYELLGVTPADGQWKWSRDRAEAAVENYKHFLREANGRTLEQFWEDTGRKLEFIRKNERTGKVENWFPPRDTRIANTLWIDIHAYENEKDYPTEKHEDLINRIISFASKPGDLVLDVFIGAGTTAAVAQKLGRRWIGCDINKGATQTTAKRLQTIIQGQIEGPRQGSLPGAVTEDRPKPASLSFSVYRVNDYDLAIQHNEALNLACEHLGVQRARTDTYFDGTLGKRLVKVIPFGHPLTPLDLQELETELKSRPREDRDIVVVCLGKEPAADSWLEDWNRHRPVNKIEVIELRTDKKYGKFFTHQPARARVDIRRVKGKIVVGINNFISPTIIERLNMDQTLFRAQITDWRAMVDSVMIDTAYDGQVFNVAFSDVPERKDELVSGRYELPAPSGPTTVAVKITDMLGEEVLVTGNLR